MSSELATQTQPIDPWKAVSAEEFRLRQDAARAACSAAGLDGLVVYSRGGACVDMYADVLYLSNHYSQQPAMGDHAGIGTARAHGVLVLPVDGPCIAVVDVPWWRPDLVVADDVRMSTDVTDAVAGAIRDTGLDTKRWALVGSSSMTAAAYRGLVSALPLHDRIRVEDEIIETLRLVKSPAEQQLIRQSVAIGDETVRAIMGAATPGATEAEAVAAGYAVLVPAGAALYDAPCGSGPNAHHFTWARLPSYDATRPMRTGEIFHFDSYGAYGGYLWDFGRSTVIGTEPSPKQHAILETTIAGVEAICDAIRPGMTASDVGDFGAAWLRGSPIGHALPEFPAVGHGIGMSWERPWLMHGDPTVLEPGMFLAVELLLGDRETGLCMFEQNGFVTTSGFELLSTAPVRWW
jgi:Xaa-Pro aminopeptidase